MAKKFILLLENNKQNRPSIKTELENDHPEVELVSVPNPLKALQVLEESRSEAKKLTMLVIDLDANTLEVIGFLETLSRIYPNRECKILLLSDQPGPFIQSLLSASRNQPELIGRKAAGQRIRSMLLGMNWPV